MKITTFALLCAPIVISCTTAPPPDSVPSPEIASPPEEPARAATPPAPPPKEASIHAAESVVPADVTLAVKQETESRFAVRVQRKGHLVALRQGAMRATGDGMAELPFAVSGAPDRPIVWESTDPTTLVTTRGLVELATDGSARLLPANAPAIVASEAHRQHACRAHDDGAGGFTVICRVRGVASAVSLTRDDPREGVFTAIGAQRTLVRADLDAQKRADAITLGYADGTMGVVVRAEATHVAGEQRPSIVIQSAERAQPIVFRFKHRRMVDDFDF